MLYTAESWPKERWPNFSFEEMRCRHTGVCDLDPQFMDALQELRRRFGPMHVTSGYRSPGHPIEAAKLKPGPHTTGKAVDIAVAGSANFELLRLALEAGHFVGFGVNQKGDYAKRFLHLDQVDRPSRTLWTY